MEIFPFLLRIFIGQEILQSDLSQFGDAQPLIFALFLLSSVGSQCLKVGRERCPLSHSEGRNEGRLQNKPAIYIGLHETVIISQQAQKHFKWSTL